jgi:hypothetical protein
MDYFKRVSVVANPANYKIVTWSLRSTVGLGSSVDFFVDKARSGGDWEEIAGPLTDTCQYIDTLKWNWNKDKNTFYRVRFMVDGEWQLSTPTQAIGKWSRSDYLKAKEICRKEYLRMKIAGESGILLKRKEWGTKCTHCTDYDTGESVTSRCRYCLGTRIVGGYYAPITLPVVGDPNSKNTSFKQQGQAHDEVRTVRAVAYPLISTDDIWINENTNERWQVGQIQTVAEIRRIPIVQVLQLKLIPQNDIIYSEEANEKALEEPEEQPTGNEHGWETPDNANCIDDFDY